MGIVSGLGRSSAVVGIPHKKVNFLQTDAAVSIVYNRVRRGYLKQNLTLSVINED